MSIRDSTQKLLDKFPHNNTWLLNQWHTGLETHVYVRPGTADQAHPSKADCWSNGVHTWKQIRWPHNAKTTPTFKDFAADFPLAELNTLGEPEFPYIESVGTTWWAWEAGESEAVVFDIDSITTHPLKGLSKKELKETLNLFLSLPYATVYKSTSGSGYHVRVGFQEGFRPQTSNHDEHALVAKVTLDKMSEDAGFDLANKIDCFGYIGWIWSTRAMGNNGFDMVKPADRDLKCSEISDWSQIPAKRMSSRPRIVAYDANGEEVDGNNILGLTDSVVVIDKEHKRILKALEGKDFNFNHVPEHNLFHTHTTALKQVHKDLNLKGPFHTATSGSNLCNCFMRPMHGGGFSIFRFGQGTLEHQLWDHSGKTTWCTYNQVIPPHKTILKMGGEWIAENKHYEFEDHADLVKCVNILGNRVPLKLIDDRHYALSLNGRGCVIKCFCDKDDKPADCDNWVRVKNYSKKVLSRLEECDEGSALNSVDQLVRLVVRNGDELGWSIHTKAGWLKCKTEAPVKRILSSKLGAVEPYMTLANESPWTLVNRPFDIEHLPERHWNKESAQLAVPCASKSGSHPHWDMILNHAGQSWDEPLSKDDKMQEYGIQTGAQYLMAWVACMIRYPDIPLPYIFLVGPENSGKSVLHEALRKCILNGVVHGGNAFSSNAGFNGEFEGKVLVAVDETDFSKNPGFIPKFKSWTNATEIQIHKKTMQPYDVTNYIKVIQTANTVEACPLDHGDTRAVVGAVPALGKGLEIPKLGEDGLLQRCLKEFPALLYTLGTMQLPPMTGRTRLPVISTDIKSEIMTSGEPSSLEYIRTVYHEAPGHAIKLSQAYGNYKLWCMAENKKASAPNDFKLQVGLKYPIYQGPRGRALSIGNLSEIPDAPAKPAFSLEGRDGRHEKVEQ